MKVHTAFSSAIVRALVAGLLVTALLAFGNPALAEEEGGSGPLWPEAQLPLDKAHRVNLLDPVKEVLSGRAWLVAEGLDPGVAKDPEMDPRTGLNWSELGGAAAGGGGAPTFQAAAASLVPFRNPAPAFSRDILISRDFGRVPVQTEPHMAVDPQDPEHIVVGMIDYNFPSLSSYVSLDGGGTWEGPYQIPYHMDDQVAGGDPVLAFDRRGSVYSTSISIGVDEFAVGPLFLSDTVSSITISRSDDGGYTWPITIPTARSGIRMENQELDSSGRLRGTVIVGFLDKPWIAVGPNPKHPDRDSIYVTYTEFETYYGVQWIGELPFLIPAQVSTTIRMVHSEDAGRSWSDPVAVSPTVLRSYGERGGDTPGEVNEDRVVQGAQPMVAPDGTVYVAWLDSTDDGSMKGLGEIHVARSDDGGGSFELPTIATTFNEIGFRPRTSFFRYWASSFPQVAVGPKGELYVAYTARPAAKLNDDGDIYLVSSDDGGYTWSRPTRINGDRGSSLQFLPSIDVGPDGKVHAMWADMRDDPSQTRYHIYYSRSDDGAKHWGFEIKELGFKVQDTRVTDFASNPNRGFPGGLFLGDYVSIQAAGDEVYMVWPDTRLGEFGTANQKIGFARRGALRSPDIYVQPSSGAGGEKITVQGFDFQPDMNVFIQLQDATIATSRTNGEGRFTANLYVPVTGEGAQDLRVFDESGNIASTSFYTEFGFGNIQQLYQDLIKRMDDLKGALDKAGDTAGDKSGDAGQ